MNDFSCLDNNFIKENEYIIKMVIGKYNWLSNYEEILQEARIWLCEAKLKYDHKRAKWQTYAKYYIEHSFKTFIRVSKMAGRCSETEGFTNVGLDILQESDLYLLSFDEHKYLDDEIEARSIYNYCLDTITDEKIKDIIKMRLEGATLRIIAYKYQCTKQWISFLYTNEINRIRKEISLMDFAKEFNYKKKNMVPIKDKIKDAKLLRESGKSWKNICKELHIGYHEIGKYIDKSKYPIGALNDKNKF